MQGLDASAFASQWNVGLNLTFYDYPGMAIRPVDRCHCTPKCHIQGTFVLRL